MDKTQIKSFEVFGLFGTDDIMIPFNEDGIKILIGENGLGKTQILNLFYYTLTANFFRLSDFKFLKLKLSFTNNRTIEISKKEINELIEKMYNQPLVKEFINEFGISQFEFLRQKYQTNRDNYHNYIEKNEYRRKFPTFRLSRMFEELETVNLFSSSLEKLKIDIAKILKNIDILYFPTYRRVEEDLFNFGYEEDELNFNAENTLIQFGMEDVKKRFSKTQNAIDKLLKEGLAQFTKDILKVVITDESITNDSVQLLNKITDDDIDIILSRVGNLLPDNQKKSVRDMVAKKEIKNPLSIYLLQKLIDIYEKQKELDKSVKDFRDACNTYLIGKEVFYDESEIKIYIKSKRTKDEIDLKYLSSGEKQIISMFSKVYLSEADKRFYILFDEPELSLSMLWQKTLLPNILKSNKCDFLLAVTHSPFIFDNDLDKYAIGLNEYVKPLNL
ncbi:MAG: ATP-binding protein [Candidatus Symbiothrix sp.]|jgi:predicted ATPase|nr:ATP-binding protein [Candidatus Symbiothrix sp.]